MLFFCCYRYVVIASPASLLLSYYSRLLLVSQDAVCPAIAFLTVPAYNLAVIVFTEFYFIFSRPNTSYLSEASTIKHSDLSATDNQGCSTRRQPCNASTLGGWVWLLLYAWQGICALPLYRPCPLGVRDPVYCFFRLITKIKKLRPSVVIHGYVNRASESETSGCPAVGPKCPGLDVLTRGERNVAWLCQSPRSEAAARPTYPKHNGIGGDEAGARPFSTWR